ncbi:MAG: TonB-dependent receptor [Planctomycetes bacterium]|nr:TonB-dependent receptor [Planctomycetota bacterium]
MATGKLYPVNKSGRALILLGVFGFLTQAFAGAAEPNKAGDLFEMSIEELMNVEVTTASKKAEKYLATASATYVITQEDIRRSGASSIPEVLRMVPGLQVAQLNSNTWAVSSRAFNTQYANKMLVMIDGRSIYAPLYGGVYWDMHDVILEDVERIEVVRGPGGTLWGANAVNGIINIITKSAKDTQGTLISGGAGTREQGFGAIRYGDKAGEGSYYRVYSKYFNRDDGRLVGGGNGNDGWDVFRGGFRIDSDPSDRDHFTLQGDFFEGQVGKINTLYSLTAPLSQVVKGPFGISGGNVLGRWTRSFSDDSEMMLQMYYDRTSRRERTFHESRDTYDIDFQHRFGLGDRHEITWGLGYRLTTDNTRGTFAFSLDPEDYRLNVFSGFLQDRISLIRERLALILGTKLEHNNYTGFEYQPGAKLAWTPDERQTIWTSVTRAVRTPTRFDNHSKTSWGTTMMGPFVYSLEAYGSDDMESEKVIAYEAGYRVHPTDKLFLDFVGFFNQYSDIRTFEGGFGSAFFTGTHFIVPYTARNMMDGETYGFEAAATYQATKDWKLSAGYSFLQMQLHTNSASTSTADGGIEGESPHNQFSVRSYLDVTEDVELDLSLYYVDNLPSDNVPHYLRLDARLGWQINENTELRLVGRNLLDRLHPEFKDSRGASFAAEAERSFLVDVVHRF